MRSSQARRNLIARQSGEHRHDFAQVLIGWRGQMDCGFRQETGRLRKGAVALVPLAAEHNYEGLSQESELLVIDLFFNDPYVQALEQACGLPFEETLFQRPEFLSLDAATLPLLDYAANLLQRGSGALNPLVGCQLVSLFMTRLCQLYSPDTLSSHTGSRLRLAQLDTFIDRRLATPPSNAELAAMAHLSESHLYHLCQQHLGQTPQQYVMQRRMERARLLVLNSQVPLAVVAAKVGFSGVSSFTRAYKKHFEATPGRARRLREH
ncbi:helix-turn-helix domain-containing protein [Motiliproteus sp. SC1-56]|uniref:helix-turn-helix transcriptional regulator n=1 Tax=Motiliproteus sp. SC1-56 TaxID=2799565 RepID=UPI001A8E3290|nr:helix-turn-helix domain-containing protein [Motiliproteus sp. SC1-56]